MRDFLSDNLRDTLMMILAIGIMTNSYLLLSVLRKQTVLQAEWNGYVKVISEWQGPSTLNTQTEINGRKLSLTTQQLRGPGDIEALVERHERALKTLAQKEQ